MNPKTRSGHRNQLCFRSPVEFKKGENHEISKQTISYILICIYYDIMEYPLFGVSHKGLTCDDLLLCMDASDDFLLPSLTAPLSLRSSSDSRHEDWLFPAFSLKVGPPLLLLLLLMKVCLIACSLSFSANEKVSQDGFKLPDPSFFEWV